MSKDKLTDYDSAASGNLDVGGISVAEGMLPSGVNNAIREQMSHLKDFASGTTGIDVLSLADDDASHAIKLQAPSAVTADTTFTLPDGDGVSGQTMITDGAGTLSWAAPYGNRNLIINGAMTVNQRGNQTITNGGDVYFVDRFKVFHNSSAAVANLQQSTVVPSGQGFGNSMLIDVTTADTSIAAGEVAILRQVIEGQNLQRLAYGTSSAKSLTISFWVRSTKTGTYILEIYHNDTQSRTQSHSYTISQADTWEYKSITFSGDTSATIDNDNAATFYVQWALTAGSDYTSGTLQTTWANTTDVNRFVGQVNFFDSTSNNFYLTGVQMEVGDVATPFEHRSYGDELARCQRYYYKIGGSVVYQRYFMASCQGSNFANGTVFFPVKMRSQPSLEHTGTAANYGIYTGDAIATCTAVPAISTTASDENVANVSMNSTSGLVSGRAAEIISNNNANAYLAFSAEL